MKLVMLSRVSLKSCLWGILVGGALGAGIACLSAERESGPPMPPRTDSAERREKSVRAPRLNPREHKEVSSDSPDYFMTLPLDRFSVELARLMAAGSEDTNPLVALFEAWGARDPAKALSAWESLSFNLREKVGGSLFQGWFSSDPDAALAYLADHRESRGELGYACRDLIPLLESDCPEKALSWLRRFSGNMKIELMKDYFTLRLRHSPEEAAEMCAQLDPIEKRRLRALEKTAFYLGKKDWATAVRWLESQPEGSALRLEALAGLCMEHPDQVTKELASLPAGEEKDQFLTYLLTSGWDCNPKLGLDYLPEVREMFQDPLQARYAVLEASRFFAQKDPAGLLKMLNALPDGEWKDTLRANYVLNNESDSISQKLALLDNLKGSDPQRFAAKLTLPKWNDARAAEEWIKRAPIPERYKKEWKQYLKDSESVWSRH